MLVHLKQWQIVGVGSGSGSGVGIRGAGTSLASSWLASGPGSGARARTGAWSRCGPGPGAGRRVRPSHFLLGVMGSRRWVDVFSGGCGFGVWSRSSSGLSSWPLPVSDSNRKNCNTCRPIWNFCNGLNFPFLPSVSYLQFSVWSLPPSCLLTALVHCKKMLVSFVLGLLISLDAHYALTNSHHCSKLLNPKPQPR